MVLPSIVQPQAGDSMATSTALATLGSYVAVCAAVMGVVMSRRDVTAA
jgi:hypothetical protein